jgi:hypothetical protein
VDGAITLILGAVILLGLAVFIVYWFLWRKRTATKHRTQTRARLEAREAAYDRSSASLESWPSLAHEMAGGWLVVSDGPDAGKHHMVVQGENLIGRGSSCHIRLDDPTVSRRHARLVVDGDRFLLFDLHSTSATYVDGKKVDPLAASPIRDRSVITMGNTDLTFKLARHLS